MEKNESKTKVNFFVRIKENKKHPGQKVFMVCAGLPYAVKVLNFEMSTCAELLSMAIVDLNDLAFGDYPIEVK